MRNVPLPGFYGKVPAVGDFVSRRLPQGFLEPWDYWLQSAISSSRRELGEEWLRIYLTSPIWRFALSPGLCGPAAWAGILMPSVDKVGRYFPLTVSTHLPPHSNPFFVASTTRAWYDKAETVLLKAMGNQIFTLEQFDQSIQELGSVLGDAQPPASQSMNAGSVWRLSIASGEQVELMPALIETFVSRHFATYSLWWSSGSELVRPSLLVCDGLPPIAGFAALLDGQWRESSWEDCSIIIHGDG